MRWTGFTVAHLPLDASHLRNRHETGCKLGWYFSQIFWVDQGSRLRNGELPHPLPVTRSLRSYLTVENLLLHFFKSLLKLRRSHLCLLLDYVFGLLIRLDWLVRPAQLPSWFLGNSGSHVVQVQNCSLLSRCLGLDTRHLSKIFVVTLVSLDRYSWMVSKVMVLLFLSWSGHYVVALVRWLLLLASRYWNSWLVESGQVVFAFHGHVNLLLVVLEERGRRLVYIFYCEASGLYRVTGTRLLGLVVGITVRLDGRDWQVGTSLSVWMPLSFLFWVELLRGVEVQQIILERGLAPLIGWHSGSPQHFISECGMLGRLMVFIQFLKHVHIEVMDMLLFFLVWSLRTDWYVTLDHHAFLCVSWLKNVFSRCLVLSLEELADRHILLGDRRRLRIVDGHLQAWVQLSVPIFKAFIIIFRQVWNLTAFKEVRQWNAGVGRSMWLLRNLFND